MNSLSKQALKKALNSYYVSLAIAIVLAAVIFFTSGNLLASITVGIALALAGFRFFYQDYKKAKDDIGRQG